MTNLLFKFHDDRTINVASRVLTRKNVPHPGGHVFQQTGTIFELYQDIIGTSFLIRFHEDQTINVSSRVLTRFYYSHIMTYIIRTDVLTKFHAEINFLTAWGFVFQQTGISFYYSHIWKNAPHPGGHVFQPTRTIFILVQDIIGANLLTNHIMKNASPIEAMFFSRNLNHFRTHQDIITTKVLTKFYDDRTINVTFIVLTRKNAPPPGGHVFQATVTI
ncbi:hypothetical protein DPMN_176494 [Dreissena polymorpha]|uniref:Uncharacterized protein n=1 Tax=Dreissena polymorpha TaxID=45954 RepID=A0A9D4EBE6_DREPO|nr:hypothetical protein DPMN_176494 [Dreissena polymorpha]